MVEVPYTVPAEQAMASMRSPKRFAVIADVVRVEGLEQSLEFGLDDRVDVAWVAVRYYEKKDDAYSNQH